MTVDSQGLGIDTEEKIGFRWVVLTHLGLANGTVVLFVLSLGVMLPSISKDLGLSPTMQGLLGSSALFGNLVLALPLSIVLSRYSGRIVLLGALVAMSVFGVGQAWAPVFAILLISRWLFGQAAAAMHPARTLLINQWFPRREIIFANGLFNGTYGIAALMALGLLPLCSRMAGQQLETGHPDKLTADIRVHNCVGGAGPTPGSVGVGGPGG